MVVLELLVRVLHAVIAQARCEDACPVVVVVLVLRPALDPEMPEALESLHMTLDQEDGIPLAPTQQHVLPALAGGLVEGQIETQGGAPSLGL